ncbi:MAG: hypothetical protein H0U74_01920 [Bradymonadaceae bacterium]|nr:hypothetical protein [Lujinxingiaceae bacterium]
MIDTIERELLGWALAGLLALGLVIAYARYLVRRGLERWRQKRRQRRARRGEIQAEGLLRRHGYTVIATQCSHRWTIHVDDEPISIELVADLIVEAAGRRFVAEVKTGSRAPRIETAATRRQLLEYRCAFEVDGVLLVDMEARKIRRVEFPLLEGAN